MRTSVALLSGLGLLLTACGGGSNGSTTPPVDDGRACPIVVDDAGLATPERLRELNAQIAGFGLRSTGSEAQSALVDLIESRLAALPGFELRDDPYPIERWQPAPQSVTGGRDLAAAGRLWLVEGDDTQEIPVASAVPYSRPQPSATSPAPLAFIAAGDPITADQAAGRIVIRDVPLSALPILVLGAVSYYSTPDLTVDALQPYERPFQSEDDLHQDLLDAGAAGAAGLVFAFDVPRAQISGYFDPHKGTHYALPAVFVGADEAAALKRAAAAGASAQIAVLAERGPAMTRNLIATLPGLSDERVMLETHTDGIGWVQDNGSAALIALAEYFSALPLRCRPRTLEFTFASGHLHASRAGAARYAESLDEHFDDSGLAFVFTIEHLGTRELIAAERADGGPGRELRFSGKFEPHAWVIPPETPLQVSAALAALQRRNLTRTSLLRGFDPPGVQVTQHCSMGGDATYFHRRLIPSMQMISGPWSLWAPGFGESAIDFARMRAQVVAAGDAVLALWDQPLGLLHGTMPLARGLRDAGLPTCDATLPSEQP